MCVAVDEGLPACDVQRRAVAEAARSAEHRSLFLVSDEQVSAFAATLESARRPALSQPAVHALAVAIDYLLVSSRHPPRRAPARRTLSPLAHASRR